MIDISFSAYRTGSTQTFTPGVAETVEFQDLIFDTFGYYSTSTSFYTPLIPGKYLFQSHIVCNQTTSCTIQIFKNETQVGGDNNRSASSTTNVHVGAYALLEMNGEDDYVQVVATNADGTTLSTGGTVNFSGEMIAPLEPVYIDIGQTLMLGGILMILLSWWLVGLIRKKNYVRN